MENAPCGAMGSAAAVFGLRRNIALLLLMMVLVGISEKIWLRFIPKYLEDLGAGALIVGLYGSLEVLLGALYALPGGYLTDRLGHRRALLLFSVLNLVGYAILLIPRWESVILAAFFFMAWSSLSLPATFSLIAEQLPKSKRVMGLSVQAIIRRIPMALGPLIGGALFTALTLRRGMPWALGIAAVLTLLAALIHLRLYKPEPPKPRSNELSPLALWRTFRPELRNLLLSDILIRFCEQIPYAFVILWVLNRAGRTEWEFGVLTAIEMATAAALYLPVALWVDSRVRAAEAKGPQGGGAALATERKPFVAVTFVFFMLFPAVLYFAAGWWGLVFAFVIRGLKEFGEPARKATIVDWAAEGLKARTVGLYYMIRDLTVSVAALAGGFLWEIRPALNLWTACAFGALGTIVYCLRTPSSGESIAQTK